MTLWCKKISDPEKTVEKILIAENSMIRTVICRIAGRHHAEGSEKTEGLMKQRKNKKSLLSRYDLFQFSLPTLKLEYKFTPSHISPVISPCFLYHNYLLMIMNLKPLLLRADCEWDVIDTHQGVIGNIPPSLKR